MTAKAHSLKTRSWRWLRTGFLVLCAAALCWEPATPLYAADARLVKIDQGGTGQDSRAIVLGLDKAAIVELPVAARDVLVSNPEIVDAVVRTNKRTYLIGLKVGQTNAFFFDEDGRQILNLEIRVERDLASLRDALSHYFPDAKIDVQAMNDNIVLSGVVASASAADKARTFAARFIGAKPDDNRIVNMLSISGKEQVMLKVTVAEMQRTAIKQLGINLSGLGSVGNVALGAATNNALSLQGQALGGLTGVASYNEKFQLGGALQALERTGLLHTLAEPNLTAISGEAASFLAGGEFPVPVSRDNNGNIQLQYKPFGVGLNFTPVVLSDGRISLKISTEVSELTSENAFVLQGTSSDGVTVPSLKVRRAETTLELPSGGSLVMAGLLSDQTRQNIDGVPGAKDLPVLGALFRSRDYQKNETELVVVVTPYLVGPTARKNIALPTDGYSPPSDMDTILMGKLNATYGLKDSQPAGKTLKGPVGFVVE
ncbi:pilus assembly protein CpaC [Parvibaculum indicum]|uniref:type II and III secretion system protein family protein n=1 Tax=Parvibaculum indicum TaxID=562969 RepID=UPI001FE2A761|nr:type II and III secretion system protein family protein [Parvibaculum indicum]NIJ40772.1 pilus assembly protein CpaC [Parvibaculum indicum]